MNKNLSIQILRALLFMLIFLYHNNVPYLNFGWCGVEIFFCISGYFLWKKILSDNNLKLRKLIKNRIKRLWFPDYIIIVLIGIFLISIIKSFDLVRCISFIFGVQNITWIAEGLDSFFLLAHTWTISIEIQTIIIIGMVLYVIDYFKIERKKAIPIMGIVSIIYVLTIPYLFNNNELFSLNPISHMFAFSIGGIVYLIEKKERKFNKGYYGLLLIGVGGILIISGYLSIINGEGVLQALLSMNTATPDIQKGRLISLIYMFIALFGGGLLCFCLKHSVSKNNIIVNTLVLMGDYSFLLYLVHYPVRIVVARIFSNIYMRVGCSFILTVFAAMVFSVLQKYIKQRWLLKKI